MPPLFKIMFILLGIAPLLRLVITLVMMTCGMAVILWLAIVFQVMFKTSAALVVVYSIFSLILISLATVKTKPENQQRINKTKRNSKEFHHSQWIQADGLWL